jgi:hypothetical protein
VPGQSQRAITISDPGAVDADMTLSLLTPKVGIEGIASKRGVRGSVAANGAILIPKSNLAFAPLTVDVDTIGKVKVQTTATSDLRGELDARAGVITLTVTLEQRWTQDKTLTDCPIGPFAVTTSSEMAGAAPYDSVTGTATTVDATFTLRAVPPGTPGCGGIEDTLNHALSLPITTTTTTTARGLPPVLPDTVAPAGPDVPIPAVVLSITLSPPPVAPTAPTTTIAPKTATTTKPKPPTGATSKPAHARPRRRAPVAALQPNKFLRDINRRNDQNKAVTAKVATTPTTRQLSYSRIWPPTGQASPPPARQPTRATGAASLASERLTASRTAVTRATPSPWLIVLSILALASMLMLGLRLIGSDLGASWARRHVQWNVRRPPPL